MTDEQYCETVTFLDSSHRKDFYMQKSQPRLCVSLKFKPLIMDINNVYFNGEAVAQIKSLDITKRDILPTSTKLVSIERGNEKFVIKVLGYTQLTLYHAKGRAHRAKSNINLEKDCQEFSLKCLLVSEFPFQCEYDILAGDNFLFENNLKIDFENGQITRWSEIKKKYETSIQYLQPNRKFYLEVHALFWNRHCKQKYVKPKVRTSLSVCDGCKAWIKPFKLSPEFTPLYKRGDHVRFSGIIDNQVLQLGLKVIGYKNNHILTAKNLHSAGKNKLTLSVPECAVKIANEDKTVIPDRINLKSCDNLPLELTVRGQVFIRRPESKNFYEQNKLCTFISCGDRQEHSNKASTSTQTIVPYSIYQPDLCTKSTQTCEIQKPALSSIFTEPYPHFDTADWLDKSPSEVSEVPEDKHTKSAISNIPKQSERIFSTAVQGTNPFSGWSLFEIREFSHLLNDPDSNCEEDTFKLNVNRTNMTRLTPFEAREFGHLIRPPENMQLQSQNMHSEELQFIYDSISPELNSHKEWCPTCKLQGECDVSVYL